MIIFRLSIPVWRMTKMSVCLFLSIRPKALSLVINFGHPVKVLSSFSTALLLFSPGKAINVVFKHFQSLGIQTKLSVDNWESRRIVLSGVKIP